MSLEVYYPKLIENPHTVTKMFDGEGKECFVIDISGNDYKVCEQTSCGNNFWGNSKPGAYGAGLGSTSDDKYKPARTGLLGQMAFGKLFGEPVDLVYRKGGDKQDNLIGKYKWDMKCAMYKRENTYIYHTNEWGKRMPVDKHIYVMSYIDSEDRINSSAKVVIVGFMLNEHVKECGIAPGKKGKGHLNYEVPFRDLLSIVKLLEAKKKQFGIKQRP